MVVAATRNHREGRETILAIEVFGIFANLGWLDLETMIRLASCVCTIPQYKGPEFGGAWIHKKSRGSSNEQL